MIIPLHEVYSSGSINYLGCGITRPINRRYRELAIITRSHTRTAAAAVVVSSIILLLLPHTHTHTRRACSSTLHYIHLPPLKAGTHPATATATVYSVYPATATATVCILPQSTVCIIGWWKPAVCEGYNLAPCHNPNSIKIPRTYHRLLPLSVLLPALCSSQYRM